MQAYSINESNYIDSIKGIDVIKGFSKQHLFGKKNDLIFSFFQTKIFELGKLNLTISLYSGIILVIFLLIILGFSSYSVLNNDIRIGELMAILGYPVLCLLQLQIWPLLQFLYRKQKWHLTECLSIHCY